MGIKKIIVKLAYPVLKLYWRLFKPETKGARCIIWNGHENKVLIVKHASDGKWYLPGGGCKKGESPLKAVTREVKEETKIILDEGAVKEFAVYENSQEGKKDVITVFSAEINDFGGTDDGGEIGIVAWFPQNHLPEETSPGTRRRINEFFDKTTPNKKW